MASPSLPQCLLCFLILSLFLFLTFSSSQQSQTYIIHMDLSSMPKVFPDHHSWYYSTLSSISQHSSPNTITTDTTVNSNHLYTYTHVIHGFSAKLTPTELSALQNSPGFVSSIPDLVGKAHTTRTPKFLGLNSQSGAWPQSNYGKGVIIGLLDSGVWPESESYRDVGMPDVPSRWKGKCVSDSAFKASMCNKKLIGVRSFNKGLIAHRPELNISSNSSRDDEGHGSHTSTIAAGSFVKSASMVGYANGSAIGVAPLAHIAMYKVLWDDHAYSSDILAAMDQAIEDGVDIISISLGDGENSLYEDAIAIASFAAMEKGIFVSKSAGNDGPGWWTAPSGIPWAVSVGASSIDREVGATITLGNGVSVFGSTLFVANSSLAKLPIVHVKNCASDDMSKIGYKIVVCTTNDYDEWDDEYGVRSGNVAGGIFIIKSSQIESYLQFSYPAAFVTPEDGELILSYINKSSNPTARMDFRKTRLGIKPAPIVGYYSSRGPSPNCPSILKPDLVAPGTLVLAAWPPTSILTGYQGDYYSPYVLLYGTSMACPHVAGVAALLKNVHPEWSPAAIRSAMMTTADTLDNTGAPIKDHGSGLAPADPLAMGAGHINPNKALNPGLIYDASAEDYMRLLCSMNFTMKQISTITRSSHSNCSTKSSDLNYPSFIAFFNADTANGTITQVFRRTVTNIGEPMSTYIADLTDMGEVKVSVEPRKLVFKQKHQKLNYKLTLKGPSRVRDRVIQGSLTWVGNGGKYIVRSPIAATNLQIIDGGND
ncbi:hypothetical protein Sjap_022458 [Stephania japonica]|uniref:Uncharacterized protein n=1 Tax=Stephania japonica TaxID=461633 RepID=A0AAP0HUF6_9MAGN